MSQRSSANGGPRFGALVSHDGIRFSVWSSTASQLWVSIFDETGERELERLPLQWQGDGVHALFVPGLSEGTRYGFRADGTYAPEDGLWFDPDKLLVDPYAVAIDRPYVMDPCLAARRGEGSDTAPLVPKAIATDLEAPTAVPPPLFRPGRLIYEVAVRAFTMRHPDVPPEDRGTIRALTHRAIIEHFKQLDVAAVELMPITAWIDERHLAKLGLHNIWGYNPVTFMALDPRLAPGGLDDLRHAVSVLREAGIGVILDLVFNHTGESDEEGPTLSLRGLDNPDYFTHEPGEPGRLVNHSGTGNTLNCANPIVQELVLDSLRHFVLHAGVDGFRFDLAPVLGRSNGWFNADAPLLQAMSSDPVLIDRIFIAEPWDLGPHGYQLGSFPPHFLEWNDRFRDTVRRFWRGDRGSLGQLASCLSGSSDVFGGHDLAVTRTVNFIAAHDGMTIADLVAYERKHNEANGEHNRDGHNENFSWNNGVEGATDDPEIVEERTRDMRALLATLFASRGTIMLTAGDEFGRTQRGNNNAYAQDNEITWLDWERRDGELENFVFDLAAFRKSFPALVDTRFLTGTQAPGAAFPDVEWLRENGKPMDEAAWEHPARHRVTMLLAGDQGTRIAIAFNGDRRAIAFSLPVRPGYSWRPAVSPNGVKPHPIEEAVFIISGLAVVYFREQAVETA